MLDKRLKTQENPSALMNFTIVNRRPVYSEVEWLAKDEMLEL